MSTSDFVLVVAPAALATDRGYTSWRANPRTARLAVVQFMGGYVRAPRQKGRAAHG
jgi:hypothetical protein